MYKEKSKKFDLKAIKTFIMSSPLLVLTLPDSEVLKIRKHLKTNANAILYSDSNGTGRDFFLRDTKLYAKILDGPSKDTEKLVIPYSEAPVYVQSIIAKQHIR